MNYKFCTERHAQYEMGTLYNESYEFDTHTVLTGDSLINDHAALFAWFSDNDADLYAIIREMTVDELIAIRPLLVEWAADLLDMASADEYVEAWYREWFARRNVSANKIKERG